MLLLGVARDQIKLAEGVKLGVLVGGGARHLRLHLIGLAGVGVRVHMADSVVANVVAMDAAGP